VIRELDAHERAQMVEKLLSVVGLSNKAHSMPSQLSGGEKQRVAVARALANNPRIVLADEPTGNLDSKSGKDVMDFLAKLWKEQGVTIILITHEPQVAAYGSRIIYLRDGKIERDVQQRPKKGDHRTLKNKR